MALVTATAQEPVNVNQAATPLEESIQATETRASLTEAAATLLGVPVNKVCDLLRNVWHTTKGKPPLTDQEMFQGISMIARFELDPVSREIYVTRTKHGLATIVGIDGWIKILDRTDHYDGFEQEIHENEDGEIEWVETRIHSTKRKHPTCYRAYMHEYRKMAGFVFETMPSHMLRIFSLRHAARLFTPVGGSVVTEEEAQAMMRSDNGRVDRTSPQSLDTLAQELKGDRDDNVPESAEAAEDAHGMSAADPFLFLIAEAATREQITAILDDASIAEGVTAEDTKKLMKAGNARLQIIRGDDA